MLFNSLIFILLFLPLTTVLFWGLKDLDIKVSRFSLIFMSFVFYAWWKFEYLFLVLFSLIFNYVVSLLIHKCKKKIILYFSIAINLALLAYFKYLNFFIDLTNQLFSFEISNLTIALPLAISFITFQQIAFLVDTYEGKVKNNDFSSYILFILFFPQLISGPIVHHSEMMPQFSKSNTFSWKLFSAGITLFILGLFKKVGIADQLALTVNDIFNQSLTTDISLIDSWLGSIAYTLQIYFDFSGYSDMAIGCGLLFGIYLPINFNSPLKSTNIINFWRTWHITLSRFLKDYLYIRMGGNRKGQVLRYTFLFITMILGGLWHGASYTFAVWGALHGLFLSINHFAKWISIKYNIKAPKIFNLTKWPITFIAVVIAFVLFRADSFTSAINIVSSMLVGSPSPDSTIYTNYFWKIIFIALLILIVKFAPNTQQIIGYQPNRQNISNSIWKPNFKWLIVTFTLLLISLYKILIDGYTEFIYRFF